MAHLTEYSKVFAEEDTVLEDLMIGGEIVKVHRHDRSSEAWTQKGWAQN